METRAGFADLLRTLHANLERKVRAALDAIRTIDVEMLQFIRRDRGEAMNLLTLVSFDIDGTLEVGEPPGIVSIAVVRRAKQLGYVVGSCSDRPIGYQEAMWERLDIIADFTVLKHRLADVRARFAAAAYYHIGDTDIDEFFARGAGFRFLKADAAAHLTWGPELFAGPPS